MQVAAATLKKKIGDLDEGMVVDEDEREYISSSGEEEEDEEAKKDDLENDDFRPAPSDADNTP